MRLSFKTTGLLYNIEFENLDKKIEKPWLRKKNH